MATSILQAHHASTTFTLASVPFSCHLRSPRFLKNLSVPVTQLCDKKFIQLSKSLSANTLRKTSKFGRKISSTTRTMAVRMESHRVLDSKSPSPALFDGTTRLYYSSRCPYAQRVWVAIKYKGLNDIECVEISLADKPIWFKEKVYPVGKVPALEHNGQVTGESMDLLTYLDQHFGGPKLAPMEEGKKQAAAELLEYTDTFNKVGFTGLSMKEATPDEIAAVVAPAFDHIETVLGRFSSEGPFFLGEFGLVDIAYAPFIERFELAFSEIRHYDIKAGRPNLVKWMEALEKVDAYASSKVERGSLVEIYKRMLDGDYFKRVGVVTDQTNAGGTPVAVN